MSEHLGRISAFDSEVRRLAERFEQLQRLSAPTRALEYRLDQYTILQQKFEEHRNLDRKIQALLAPIKDIEHINRYMNSLEFSRISELSRLYESRFQKPKVSAILQLTEKLSATSTALGVLATPSRVNDIQEAMQRMETRWIDIHDQAKSFSSFVALQDIGTAIGRAPPFSDEQNQFLRGYLGDYRDHVKWTKTIFTDPIVRLDFYREQGLDSNITALPPDAFLEASASAGLTLDFQDISDGDPSQSINTDKGEDEDGFRRTNRAHSHLLRFEITIRNFINNRMVKAFGSNWEKTRTPSGMYERWLEKKKKALAGGESERTLISYADFTDYLPIIERSDNWKEVFSEAFRRVESVRESLQRLYPIRICTMHARIITQDDEIYLVVEVKRLMKAFS